METVLTDSRGQDYFDGEVGDNMPRRVNARLSRLLIGLSYLFQKSKSKSNKYSTKTNPCYRSDNER